MRQKPLMDQAVQPGQIGATRMACLQIKGEAEYLALLSAVTTAVAR